MKNKNINKPDYKKTLRACYLGFITQAIAANFAPLIFLKLHNDYEISLGLIALIPTAFFFTQLVVDIFCAKFGIKHHVLRPRTPWHNGKVERSHRNDQDRFYNHLSFYSFHDLQVQMKRYLYRSNNIPMAVLGWKSPNQKHKELESTIV